MLRVFLTGLPEWATFDSDGSTVDIVATDADRSWSARFGRCVGTSPGGERVELDCLDLIDRVGGDLVVSGSADQLDRWFWRRLDHIDHAGDPALFSRLADLVAEVTG